MDARGATINYSYDNRGLTTQVSTTSPNLAMIPVTPTVTYSYDNLGNRTQMTDGTGTTNYSFNQMSEIISETKQFTELTQALTLQYEYSFSGQVKKIDILPNNTSVSYNFDKASRVTSISGTGFTHTPTNATVTNIVSNISYRAWNSYKSMSSGNNVTTSFAYDNNLKVASFQIPDLMNLNYQYNADGKVKFVDDLRNPQFDRGYTFDHKGRLTVALTAEDASGLPRSNGAPPYMQYTSYDNFDNVNSRSNDHWTASYASGQAIFVNNRRNGWIYNEDGDVVNFDGNISTQDASGQQIKLQNKIQNSCPDAPTVITCSQYKVETTMNFDGDGQEVVKNSIRTRDYYYLWNTSRRESEEISKEFSLKSTVLGGFVVFTLTQNSKFFYPSNSSSGTHTETRIFNEGRLMAKMGTLNATSSPSNVFTWSHVDPMSTVVAESNTGAKWVKDILDPNGSGVGLENPYPEEPEETKPPRIWDESGNGEMGFGEMVEVDGILMNRGQAERLSSAGATSQCPRQGCGAQMTENGWAYWTAYADGYAGYLPMGATYAGSGYYQTLAQRKRSQQKPTLKTAQNRTKAEYKKLKAIGYSSIYDNEGNGVVDANDESNYIEAVSTAGIPSEGFRGGVTNPIAQLVECLRLKVVRFDELGKVNPSALTILKNTFGNEAASIYAAMTVYNKAVFLNTAAAAKSVNVSVDNLTFYGFYMADKRDNGLYVDGFDFKGNQRKGNPGSLEIEMTDGKVHFDVDLYNVGSFFRGGLWNHGSEVLFNKRNFGTHPGDAALQLSKRKVITGVSCQN